MTLRYGRRSPIYGPKDLLVRNLWHRYHRLIAGIMLAAALSFVLQGVAAATIGAADGPPEGVIVWHSHTHDGADYVHAHDLDADALDHDHDGIVLYGSGVGSAAVPAPPGVLGRFLVPAGPLVMISPGIHADALLNGLRRPPRTPFIA